MATNYHQDHNFELSLLPQNTRFLLGIDEVGRGPLAGPLTVGGFLLDLNIFSPAEFTEHKIRDSKKLSPLQRQNPSILCK
jgi:ribonuclease HII